MADNSSEQQNKPAIDDILPGDLLSDDEKVIFAIKPSLWALLFWSFRTIVLAVVLAVFTLLTCQVWPRPEWGVYVIRACGAVIIARVGFAFLQWISRSYVLTDRRVIRIRGVFTIDIFQCSLGRIQNTFLQLSLPQRLLRLGDIAFTTAGTGRIEAIWRHLKNPLQIHYQLINAINANGSASSP